MTRHTLATLILLAAAPLAATAAGPAKDTSRSEGQSTTVLAETPPMFKELDRNHDGQISQSEAKRSADVSARFSALDTDKNKQISSSEWQADENARQHGAAGVSGESREPGDLKGQSAPGTTGESPKSKPDTKSTY